jgi:hypothetical protein
MAGIVSCGAYILYYRLPRSVISKAWGQSGDRSAGRLMIFKSI